MHPDDTSPKIWKVYYRRLSEMTPSERLQNMARLWRAGNELQREGVRRRFPHASDEEVTFQVAVLRFGEELARKAYGR